VRRYFDGGLVRINGRKASGGTFVKAGDEVKVLSLLTPARARPELALKSGGPLKFISVLFEDEHILVISKQRAMSTVTLASDDDLTVADCVCAYCPEAISASPDEREAGLVQRLDFFTGGILAAAKTRTVWEKMRSGLFASAFHKEYLALVSGTFEVRDFELSWPLKQSRDGKTMEIIEESDHHLDRQQAQTHVVCLKELAAASVVRAEAAVARRHQIRVHLAACEHPLIGDTLYGSTITLDDFARSEPVPEAFPNSGFLLHASRIRLPHPITGEELDFQDVPRFFEEMVTS
jgi:23S rRNA pseudouridine1911/1915/1917 synthase